MTPTHPAKTRVIKSEGAGARLETGIGPGAD
jgi:hypothetical protein